ncbi:ATP12-domain-containing protein [Gonapodya prolifera JEL478]|uniref:ATP12-domain-containing protein n=1 Tax=Gonapodya prolifera (strain JEL478) TaxID=1344416 RepID=A0A139A263_GONPJ|nr:ATP12-domain-containing protein [Gonapodya prolifera JEL478]|eukprot:KXS10880.1 ATP12-domain-containing protein [Gonapodya prolifera JEL478]
MTRKIKRFWKTADVKESDDGWVILLDGRPLKTPTGKQMILPKDRRLLATLVAAEWESVKLLKQYSLVLTSLAARAVDDFADPETRQKVIKDLCKYIHTDTICYRQPYPDPLIRLQQRHWDPLIKWLQEEYGIRLHTTEGILSIHQEVQVVDALRQIIDGMDPFELAAFERATLHTKSFVTGLALVKRALTAEEAAAAARVEVQHQIDMWGEVEDAHDVDAADMKRHLGAAVTAIIRN